MTQSNTNPRKGKHCDENHGGEATTKKPDRDKVKTPRKITESYLHNAALYYLQRFASSSANFRKIMGRKIDNSCRFHTEQDREDCYKKLDALIVKFIDTDLLDDHGYSRAMVTSMRRRGLSSRAIQAKLFAKGLTGDLIKEALHHYDHQYSEEEGVEAELRAAITCARKKRLLPFNKEKEIDKSLGSLARAGFSYDIAQKVISMDIAEASEIIASYL